MGDTGTFTTPQGGMSRTGKKLLLLVAGAVLTLLSFLANYAFETVDEKAEQGVEANHKVELVEKDVEYLKEGQEKILDAQQTIIDTLYIRPNERRPETKPQVAKPQKEAE